ncbi:ChaN family lipoprotein [Myxococcus llanfairpwllgwyngyllgogerychwyrndrobwllllantysiliogogogochensis]|uniref:ChaN family lipoprotein n=1 Tax=Myxococcus llanfairpwllgwyngyllgogerychwyrndrobwllllantysiliogogogochensis TaxID=2590453 RepID=A0A540X5P5_9BACT|nr:ChaN family lipoprotein [Myxococcus llanfairpwllgwyngyllgogerychwyrndrobwllllantysiliogogogochensis]TQF16577.1 ChaN family lipoprotein [Myxococcus llanfairpwllgwyngyllgogerychwyrndrobwllllantysiliogogogochensis]
MMRLATVLACVFMVTGCAAHRGELDYPDREAVYDRPLAEMWPEVRGFFTRNELSFREDKGSMVLETEWRQEFGGSRISGFFHRYMVVGRRETPTSSKLQIFRITKSVNKTLSPPGNQIDWGVNRNMGGPNQEDKGQSVEDFEDRLAFPRGENGFFAESGQGQRDMVMEWRVFREVAPLLANAENAPQPVRVAKAPDAKEAPSQFAVECGLPIIGLGKQAKPGAVLLLGELHGTQEVPRFVAQASCQATVAGIPVTVGLELPLENQGRVDAFLESQGGEEDWLKLMEAPFWRSPYPDGRGSAAMANMLEHLRQLRAQGLDVDVFVFDHPKANGQQREDAMAGTVAFQVESSPRRFHMVLSGNIHARTKQGLPWDKKHRPMGLLLKQRLDSVVSLDMAYDTGTTWICSVDSKGVRDRLDCGVREAKGKDNGERYFVHTWDSTNAEGYHGVFYVGAVNASAPAIRLGEQGPGKEGSKSPFAREEGKLASSH